MPKISLPYAQIISASGSLAPICLLPASLLHADGEWLPSCSDSTKWSCCEITGVSADSCVVAGDLWRIVGCGEEVIVLEHATGDVVVELLYLFPNVSKESAVGPAANDNDGEGGYSVQVHLHGGS